MVGKGEYFGNAEAGVGPREVEMRSFHERAPIKNTRRPCDGVDAPGSFRQIRTEIFGKSECRIII